MDAALYIQTIEKRQGLKIACPEEIAFRSEYISADQLVELAKPMEKNEYGQYLLRLLNERFF
jgi:glucose-1-phosphate thymidylyltransferase